MASNDRGAGSQEWKHGPEPASGKPVAHYAWQAEKVSAPERRGQRRKKIAGCLALAGIVCAIGALIWMIRIYRPIRVVLAGAGYETNLAVAHNAWGWRALAELSNQLRGSSVSSPWWHSGEIQVTEPRRLD